MAELKYKTKEKRLCAITDRYYELHGKKPFRMEDVAEWAISMDLYPPPTRSCSLEEGADWERKLEESYAGGLFDFKAPDLSGLPAADEQKQIAEKWTRIKFCVREDAPEAHTAWLVVGVQSFCVTPQSADTPKDASWHCLMLAKAILNILSDKQLALAPSE